MYLRLHLQGNAKVYWPNTMLPGENMPVYVGLPVHGALLRI